MAPALTEAKMQIPIHVGPSRAGCDEWHQALTGFAGGGTPRGEFRRTRPDQKQSAILFFVDWGPENTALRSQFTHCPAISAFHGWAVPSPAMCLARVWWTHKADAQTHPGRTNDARRPED